MLEKKRNRQAEISNFNGHNVHITMEIREPNKGGEKKWCTDIQPGFAFLSDDEKQRKSLFCLWSVVQYLHIRSTLGLINEFWGLQIIQLDAQGLVTQLKDHRCFNVGEIFVGSDIGGLSFSLSLFLSCTQPNYLTKLEPAARKEQYFNGLLVSQEAERKREGSIYPTHISSLLILRSTISVLISCSCLPSSFSFLLVSKCPFLCRRKKEEEEEALCYPAGGAINPDKIRSDLQSRSESKASK